MTDTHFELHLSVEAPVTAVNLLAEHCELSKQQLKQIMQKGAVWVTPGAHGAVRKRSQAQRVRRAKALLNPGDELHLYYDQGILATEPTPCELVADCGEYSVWVKPNGIYSQGTKWGDHCTVVRWAERHLVPERTAWAVHRLDRATTGLILLAHNKRIANALSRLFEHRAIEKRYRALVHGELPGEPSADRLTVRTPIDERAACSHFTPIDGEIFSGMTLVDVHIETGRKHQIRRHLAELGCPIVGDRLHGIEREVNTGRDLQLCAYYLRFSCPISQEEKQFELPVEKQPWNITASE